MQQSQRPPTTNQLRVMLHLRRRGQSYQYAIEQDLDFPRGTAATVLLRLAARGWIEECAPPAEAAEEMNTRREPRKYYRLTPEGGKILKEV